MEIVNQVAKIIGYAVLILGTLKLLFIWLSARAAARRIEMQKASDLKWKEVNPEAYALELQHRENMERLRAGLPVDPKWAEGMQKFARNLAEIRSLADQSTYLS